MFRSRTAETIRQNVCKNARWVNSIPNALELRPCRRSGEHRLLTCLTTDLDHGKFLLQLLYLLFLIIEYLQMISRRIAPTALQCKKAYFAPFTVEQLRTATASTEFFRCFPDCDGPNNHRAVHLLDRDGTDDRIEPNTRRQTLSRLTVGTSDGNKQAGYDKYQGDRNRSVS